MLVFAESLPNSKYMVWRFVFSSERHAVTPRHIDDKGCHVRMMIAGIRLCKPDDDYLAL